MPELEDFPPMRGDQPASPDPVQIQRSILDEQVELWWFRDPAKSLLCYSVAVLLILGCGLGGILLLSTTTSFSSDWRMGAGMALCLLALAVLLKQLLSSAVQDMNCVRSRRRIDMLKSGGLSDLLVVLITGLCLVVCGAVLLKLALGHHMPKPGVALNDMYISGVVLLAGGGQRWWGWGCTRGWYCCWKGCGQDQGSGIGPLGCSLSLDDTWTRGGGRPPLAWLTSSDLTTRDMGWDR